MSVSEFLELGITSVSVMPPVEDVSKMVDVMRMMDANAIVDKLMKSDAAQYIDVVKMVTSDLTVDEIIDTAAELIRYIYPGVYNDILKDVNDSKKLFDVLTLCATEVLDASD